MSQQHSWLQMPGTLSVTELSLVIPTFNERDSVAPLLAELDAALAGVNWDVLFVDDSIDGTDEIIRGLADTNARIRLLHRAENRGGLAGAVVDGLDKVLGTYVCVLDADLQHPPQRIPELLSVARESEADIVIASRYISGGSTGGLDGPMRQMYSRGLRFLTQAIFPRRLSPVSDPLGGFFLMNRSILQGVRLRPVGYKILLEILVRCTWESSGEVPYRFQPRRHGDSKADFRQGLRFLRHVGILVMDCSPLLAPVRLLSRGSMRAGPAPVGSRT